jgi:peptidoglycan/xylan/chitin deacetylase (PgdA/CDA1 family)
MPRLGLSFLLLGLACDLGAAPTQVAVPAPSVPSVSPPAPARTEPVFASTRTSSRRGPAVPAPPEADPADPSTLQRAEREATATREVFFAPGDVPSVALTFDDGPSEGNTTRILEVLRRHGVHATFFMLGERAHKMPELVAEVAAAGHDIGNHSWSHGSLRSMLPSQIETELDDTNAAVAAVTGTTPGLFRPPFGRYAPSSLPIVAARGMNFVLWSVDAEDWGSEADEIAARVVADTGPGDIVLLHDRTAATAAALPQIIVGLRAKGLQLVTVSELTGLSPRARMD